MKALVGVFNQEKALVGAFSVIVKTGCVTNGSFYSTTPGLPRPADGRLRRGQGGLAQPVHLRLQTLPTGVPIQVTEIYKYFSRFTNIYLNY